MKSKHITLCVFLSFLAALIVLGILGDSLPHDHVDRYKYADAFAENMAASMCKDLTPYKGLTASEAIGLLEAERQTYIPVNTYKVVDDARAGDRDRVLRVLIFADSPESRAYAVKVFYPTRSGYAWHLVTHLCETVPDKILEEKHILLLGGH
jgi:hypothetical protein